MGESWSSPNMLPGEGPTQQSNAGLLEIQLFLEKK